MATFAGKYKYQTNENYEDYLCMMQMTWLQRKRAILFCPRIVIKEEPQGTLKIKCGSGGEKTLVLGEEHLEQLPNGERAKAVTVREGDNCLITRLKSPWNLELREEFTTQGMTQYVRHLEGDLEAVRVFKRC